MFSLVNALDSVDRGIISILIGPIKRDLLLTDTEISILIGFAFSFFYAIVGLPMSRLADTRNRKLILSFGIAAWSLATAGAAFAKSFAGLFVSRGLTGAGESLKGPNALSMISDLVPREKYPRAMSVYQFGISLGGAMSLIIGGTMMGMVGGKTFEIAGILVLRDWQLIFLSVGLPGLFVALIIALTVKEPARRGREGTAKPPFLDVFRFIWREKSIYGPFLIGGALLQIEATALMSWRIPFYQRTFGWGPEDVGPIMGVMAITLMPIGLALGAWLGERLALRNAGAMIKLSIIGTVLSLPISVLSLLAPTAELALTCQAFSLIALGVGAPASTAAIQTVTPNEYRGQITAAFLFTISVIGNALGPLSVALLTDYVFGDEAALRYAMISVAISFGVLGLFLKFLCFTPYKRRVDAIIAAERAAG